MGWIEDVGRAIGYMEENITRDLSVEDVAGKVYLSPFYFQKGFAMLCGMTVGEYIRRRRLSLAGSELMTTDEKVVNVALKYGYDSPDSFTRAFSRFHGATPTAVRRQEATVKSFGALRIHFTLEGGYMLDYKIVEKDAFTVMGVERTFAYEDAQKRIPEFWNEHYRSGNGKLVCGMYGISIDEHMRGDSFEYLIADDYVPAREVPAGFVTRVIPKHSWAVFPCKGPMPQALQNVNNQIFSQWLPSCGEYEIAEGYCVEMYADPEKYKNGNQDENYHSEMWVPVKKKLRPVPENHSPGKA